ncbi:hypothetical protein [Phycicoccus flavus]|uniref:hypothetical protein n=1 Tax=Phycicoccus flavus TaxID=2502783 RepID=UPI000FEBBFF6|nr:hypothetical protein [Phycicoccus flavus]NHA68386.1 hypothetical protein [Phycicoccus flavus]
MNGAADAGTTSALPGFLAFVAFALLALALWFLMRNMNDRMRRMSYRQQAARRGRDEPQAGPEDAVADEPAEPEASGQPRDEGDAFRGDEPPGPRG